MKKAQQAHTGQVRSVSWDDDNGSSTKCYWDVEIQDSGGRTTDVHVDPTSGKAAVSSDSGDMHSDMNSGSGQNRNGNG
ncbi:PepSY domain-containing protein [Streptomyces sp. NPDC101490]|uniref:PepSY domain-containing protein n=1 Tax=Streptomyces sp. NPDC101490 TaxID=3366143 RepID=UPI00380DCB24